jgi:hypothetical protein
MGQPPTLTLTLTLPLPLTLTLRPNPNQMWEEMHANDIPADEIRRSVGAQDGEGCCCNFLVYDKLTRKIPFWSHAVGANPGTCDVRSSSDGGWSW